jgi:protein-S-isoprenylcysteine O-methyltransferase Ste14
MKAGPRVVAVLLAVLAILASAVIGAYFIGFVAGAFVPKSIDTLETDTSVWIAVAIDFVLVMTFALHHSVMARRRSKKYLGRYLPPYLERSIYALTASAALALLMVLWRPLPQILWSLESRAGIVLLTCVFCIGWCIALAAIVSIDPGDLTGWRQVQLYLRGQAPSPPAFQTPGLYQWARHPLYFGMLIALWATPRMSMGHLLLAATMSTYVLIAIPLEERDLIHSYGETYRLYRLNVPMLLPLRGRRPVFGPSRS